MRVIGITRPNVNPIKLDVFRCVPCYILLLLQHLYSALISKSSKVLHSDKYYKI